jgi:hypothetical protein
MSTSTALLTKPVSIKPRSKPQPAVVPDSGAQAINGKPLSEEAIRLRAYEIWEAAGRLEGDGVQSWLEAERELSHAN